MQRITDAVQSGIHFYVGGWVDFDRWPAVEEKLCLRYPGLTRNRDFAHRCRKKGEPVYRLVVFQPKNSNRVHFNLLTNKPDTVEQWKDATSKKERLRFWDFEAISLTKKDARHPVWTWRVAKEHLQSLRNDVARNVRNNRVVTNIINDCKHWPGFAEVRAQHAALGKLLLGEWIRAGNGVANCPEWPRLGYIRRKKTA